jgi:predicted alpha/beta superfamily hydrolase
MRNLKYLSKYAVMVTLCLSCLSAFSQNHEEQIIIGERETIYSNILHEEREILIHVPKSHYETPGMNYPVLILLDGDGHFEGMVGMLTSLASHLYDPLCPEMIVVGIPNTDRLRDLTPSHMDDGEGEYSFFANSGGGDQFMKFVEFELLKHIDANYPTAPYRVMVGHSLGGLMVINTLFRTPHLFDSYIAIDPSLWYNDKYLLNDIWELLDLKDYSEENLYVSAANTLEEEMTYETIESDTTEQSEHIRAILEFSKEVSKDYSNYPRTAWNYYPDDTHGSVPLISEYDGIRFLFDWFKEDKRKVLEADKDVPSDEVLSWVVDYSKNLSKVFKSEILPDEQWVNYLGYHFMGLEDYNKAYEFFRLNLESYPSSPNCYDSMGEYYRTIDEHEKSDEYYKLAEILIREQREKEEEDLGVEIVIDEFDDDIEIAEPMEVIEMEVDQEEEIPAPEIDDED